LLVSDPVPISVDAAPVSIGLVSLDALTISLEPGLFRVLILAGPFAAVELPTAGVALAARSTVSRAESRGIWTLTRPVRPARPGRQMPWSCALSDAGEDAEDATYAKPTKAIARALVKSILNCNDCGVKSVVLLMSS
jgi:hypothetical protein